MLDGLIMVNMLMLLSISEKVLTEKGKITLKMTTSLELTLLMTSKLKMKKMTRKKMMPIPVHLMENLLRMMMLNPQKI